MKITVKYYKNVNKKPEFSHESSANWEATEEYCPFCGKQKMYVSDGDDMDVGCQYICVACGHYAYLDTKGKIDSSADLQRLKALQSAPEEAETPKGEEWVQIRWEEFKAWKESQMRLNSSSKNPLVYGKKQGKCRVFFGFGLYTWHKPEQEEK